MNIAILDDYQSIALEMVDWSALSDTAARRWKPDVCTRAKLNIVNPRWRVRYV